MQCRVRGGSATPLRAHLPPCTRLDNCPAHPTHLCGSVQLLQVHNLHALALARGRGRRGREAGGHTSCCLQSRRFLAASVPCCPARASPHGNVPHPTPPSAWVSHMCTRPATPFKAHQLSAHLLARQHHGVRTPAPLHAPQRRLLQSLKIVLPATAQALHSHEAAVYRLAS